MAVTPAPAVTRAIQILKQLALEPRVEFTLSELARKMGISRGSCQTLMLALISSGMVVRREPGPTYRLGLELIALGEAAKMSMDVASLAQAELIRLRDAFRASGMAGFVSGTDIVVFGVAAQPHPLGYSIAAGARTPFCAPIGPIYVAWSEDSQIAGWLERATPPLSQSGKKLLAADLVRIRSRGWSASARRNEAASLDPLTVHEIADDELEMGDINVAGISAPVFDISGKMACSLALTAFPSLLSGAEIREIAIAVKAAADRITRQLGGAAPGA